MNDLLALYQSLSLSEQFEWGASLAGCLMLMVLAAIICGPSILGAAQLLHRELFPDLEDDEAKLVESQRRRRELDAAAAGLRHVDANTLDGRRLNQILTTMPSPKHAQTRVH